jgi:hypothetical protein
MARLSVDFQDFMENQSVKNVSFAGTPLMMKRSERMKK